MNIAISLFIICFIQTSLSYDYPCMSHFFISNADHIKELTGIGPYTTITNECFDDLPNIESESYGHSMGIECWIHVDYLHIHKGDLELSRCGECLEITGPSQNPTTCVVVGTFSVTNNTLYSKEEISRMVIVRDTIFKSISTPTVESNSIFTQVTLREIDCNFNFPPLLVSLKKESQMTEIALINSALIIEKFLIKNITYYPQKNGHCLVPTLPQPVSIKIISLDGRIVSFSSVDLQKISSYRADQQFAVKKIDSCPFLPSTQVYVNSTKREQNQFFKWMFNKVNTDFSVQRLSETDNSIHFVADDYRTTFCIGYPTVIKMYDHFSMMVMEMEVNGSSPKYAFSTLGHGNQFSSSVVGSVFVCNTNIPVKVLTLQRNGKHYSISIKMSIPKHCYGYLNVIAITFWTEVGTIFDIKNITLVPKKENHVVECDVDSFDCQNTECTPDYNDNSLYATGCQPKCGYCRTGYSCESGKCVEQTSKNSRSHSPRVFICLCLILLLLSF